jgi:hypothetical protein
MEEGQRQNAWRLPAFSLRPEEIWGHFFAPK